MLAGAKLDAGVKIGGAEVAGIELVASMELDGRAEIADVELDDET